MKIDRTFRIITAAVIMIATVCISMAVRPTDASAATGSAQQIANEAGQYLNNERTSRGLQALPVSWSDSIAGQMASTCGDPKVTTGYAISVCASTSGSAVQVLMGSSDHNAIITKLNATSISIGVACVDGTIHFGATVVDPYNPANPTDPSATFSPAITSPSAGSSCPSAAPVTTPPAPPPTQPPAQPTTTQGQPTPTSVVTPPASTHPTNPSGGVAGSHPTPTAPVPAQAPGTKTAVAKDGTKTVVSPNGTKTVTEPNGTTVVVAPDGTKTTTSKDGAKTVTAPDGHVVTVAAGERTAAASHVAAGPSSNGWWWVCFGGLALVLIAGAAIVLFRMGRLPFFRHEATDQK